MLVIGIGTGRCGTKSLAGFLNQQPESKVTHEHFSCGLTWTSAPQETRTKINQLREREARLVGDVHFSWLNRIPLLFDLKWKNPLDLRIVILERQKELVVNSFLKQSRSHNYWQFLLREKEKRSPWDCTFPTYCEQMTKAQAVERYWEDYHYAINILRTTYPDSCFYLRTEELSNQTKLTALLDWLEFPEEGRVLTQVHLNQSKRTI